MEEIKPENLIPAPVEPGHWFCHSCHKNFGVPSYIKGDDNMVYVCPACYSNEIEPQ